MKYTLPLLIGTECRNSEIDHVWVLDADRSNYFEWKDSSLPKIHRMNDARRIALAAAADGKMNGYAGVCIFPSVISLLEAVYALHAINTSRTPLFVVCFAEEQDLLPESKFSSMLNAAEFFVRTVTDPDRVDSRIAGSLQYAIAHKMVSVLLVDRKLKDTVEYDGCWRYKVHRTAPVVLPPDHAIAELASIINAVGKVLVFCGEQCRNSINELKELTSLIKSPLTYVPAIRKQTEGKVPYEVGFYGNWCEHTVVDAIQDAELILLLDYSEKDFSQFPLQSQIVQLTPSHLSGLDADKRKRIYRGDIKETLRRLLPLLHEKTDSSFADTLVREFADNRRIFEEVVYSDNELLRPLVHALNDQIDQKMNLCSCGYHSYVLTNLLLNAANRHTLDLPHSLLCQGGILFQAVGLNAGEKEKPVMVFIDAERQYDELSGLLPMSMLDYPLKICVLNSLTTAGKPAYQSCSYEMAAQTIQLPYFSFTQGVSADRVVSDWINTEGSAILEIFDISFPDTLLHPTNEQPLPVFSESFLQSLSGTLTKLHTGKCFYYYRSLNADQIQFSELNEFMVPLYTNVSTFYAALGASKVKSDIPVCVATRLSDILQMLPGIWEAWRTHTPVLFLITLFKSRDLFTRKELLILRKMIQIVSSYHYLAEDPEKDMGLIVGQAIAEAQYLGGVGTIIFDPNLYQSDSVSSIEIFDSPYVESVVYPNETELEEVAHIINHSKNTVVFAGSGCRHAHREVIELVRKIKAPLGWSFRSKDQFDHDNLYPVGMNGLLINQGLEEAFRKCDVLILLGTSLHFHSKIPKTCQIIQIDLNPHNLGAQHPVDYGVVGDIRLTIRKLLPLLLTIGNNSFAERCSRIYLEERERYIKEIDLKASGQEGGILIENVFRYLNLMAPKDAWLVADMVIPWYLTALNIQSNGTRRIFSTGDSIYTSNGTAFALGALAAGQEKPLIVICSNFTFINQLDNLIKLTQKQQNIKMIVLHLWADDYHINYSNLQLSTHMMGMIIESNEDLEKKLSIALSMPGPVVIDVPILRKELVKSPPLIPALAQRYNAIVHKLFLNSKKEEMQQTSDRMNNHPSLEDFDMHL